MPTENEITEKAYVKKHKLNQTLNELFLALTQNKPENPIEFAKKHFESKLPTPSPPPPAIDEIKVSNILNISNALSNLSTVNKINKIIIKENKKLTEEEILENEFISVNNDLNDDNFENTHIKISYKSDLKKRETINKHKQDLKELVEKNLKIKDEPEKITNNKQLPSNYEDLDEDEKELIQNEIAFADTSNYVSNKKKKKQQQERDKRISFRASIKNLNNESIMEPKTFVCSVCAKPKNEELNNSIVIKDEVNISENKSEIKNRSESFAKSNISASKNIFDLLIEKSNEQINKSKQNDTFDDDNIESASQVCGPRPITPFDSGTSRSINIQETNFKDETGKSSGVLGWLLTTQQHMNSENLLELKNEINKNIKSPSVVSKATTLKSNNDEQHWRKQSSSGSEISLKNKNKK